ncbi:hypothetical protein L208DRAFT_1312106 [Tricholoma matsutake]|nr:hypothetical protein L208DRAFT_1312106 [Tricholoma matsutake 945]
MSNKSLAIFNPFLLQLGPKGALQNWTQEVIWYAESRFRWVLLEIKQSNLIKQQWMQKCLYNELMYVMSWIGISNTIGLMIAVPILLQSLADSPANINIEHLLLRFHPSLLAALDDGVATEAPIQLVDSYACDWWRHYWEPGPKHILGIATLDECLNTHRQYVLALITDSSHPGSQVLLSQPDCQSCLNLQGLVQDSLAKLCSMHNFINGCESPTDAALNANTRHAAGFHQLHELALLKELQAQTPALAVAMALVASSKASVTRQSNHIAAHAKAKLKQLQSLPARSHKWTWGVDLTEKDVLGSNQTTMGKGKTLNFGYTYSLPDGANDKENSITASIPTAASANYSPPPDVTGLNAALYFTDTESNEPFANANANTIAIANTIATPNTIAIDNTIAIAIAHATSFLFFPMNKPSST